MPVKKKVNVIKPKAKIQKAKLFWITLVYTAIFLIILSFGTLFLWDKHNFSIAYVPIDILEWAFIGGMVGVLYKLSYYPHTIERANFAAWIIAKPVIGVVMGGLIYFLAVSGSIFLNGSSSIKNTELLDVFAFIGGFSDRLTISLINQILDKSFGDDDDNDNNKKKSTLKTLKKNIPEKSKT